MPEAMGVLIVVLVQAMLIFLVFIGVSALILNSFRSIFRIGKGRRRK